MSARPGRVGWARLIVAAVLAIAGSLFAANAASAHAELLSSDPADGSVLDAPPASVTLTFSEALMAPTVAVAVSDAGRQVFDLGAPAVDGKTVTIPWPAQATAGAFTVAYRVVSQDGHPIEGAIGLTIEGDAASPTASVPAASASATTTAPTPDPTETTATSTTASESSVGPAVGMGIVALLVAIFAVIIINKRKQP